MNHISSAQIDMLNRLSRFGIVGGLGFVVDAGLTTTLVAYDLSPFSSRLIAMALAILTTWRLNRVITFGASTSRPAAEGLRYGAVALVAALINYLFFAMMILSAPTILPVFAIAIATGISMIVSYLGYTHFAFRVEKEQS